MLRQHSRKVAVRNRQILECKGKFTSFDEAIESSEFSVALRCCTPPDAEVVELVDTLS